MAGSWEDVRRYFDTTAVAHLATLMPDGSPHSVPVWVGLEGEHLVVFMISDSLKDRNLRRDPRVAVSITSPDQPLDMALVRGEVIERRTGAEAMPAVDAIAQRYTGEQYEMRDGLTVYLIRPRSWWSLDYTAS